MARASALIARLAGELHLEPDEVVLTARRLREASLFIRETKWPSSWTLSPRDGARLLTAILADVPALQAPKYVQLAERTSRDSGGLETHLDGSDYWPPLLDVIKSRDCSFVDAIEALITYAVEDIYSFNRNFQATSIEYGRNENVGTLCLNHGNALVDRDKYISIIVHFSGSGPIIRSDLTRSSRCGIRAISAIAEVLRDA